MTLLLGNKEKYIRPKKLDGSSLVLPTSKLKAVRTIGAQIPWKFKHQKA